MPGRRFSARIDAITITARAADAEVDADLAQIWMQVERRGVAHA